MVAITALNDDYTVFETNGKMGVIRTSNIKTISEPMISDKKAVALSTVEIFEMKNGDNPYKILIGKRCTVKFRRGDFSTNVNLGGLPTTEIVSATNENMTVLFKNKEMVVKTDDVLVVLEY